MSTDGILKGVLVGTGAALLVMYLAKQAQKGAGQAGKLGNGADTLKDMSDEKLAELKDNIEDILAERGL